MVDGNGGSATVPITVTVTNINDAPTFGAGSYTASINEQQSSGTAVTFGSALSSSDEDGDSVTYSLVGKNLCVYIIKMNSLKY